MKIWIDSDSCPVRIREIICRASDRTGISAVFVANRKIPLKGGRNLEMVTVGTGLNDADNYIVSHADYGDIIITRDIPLAARLVEKDVAVLDDRGSVYTRENIRERLSVRNFMQELREAGLPEVTSGQLGERDIRAFANTFDRELNKAIRNRIVEKNTGTDAG